MNEAYHAWSKDGQPCTSTQLFRFFKQEVIPLAGKLDVPGEPPLILPSPPEMQPLGTKSELAMNMKSRDVNNLAKFKRKAYVERDRREANGDGDRWSEMQRSVMPDIDSTLIGFRIEMLFEYTETDGATYLDWCHGEVTLVIGDKSKYAKIRWDEECLRPGDRSTTQERLLQTKWNPELARKGAWRDYLTK
jgi:hypothetical protein